MTEQRTQVLVIGAGPGGYVCALRAAQLGLQVTVVDPQAPGGTCLNVGCIPSKAIIHAAEEFAAATANASDGGRIGIRAAAPTIDLAETMAWKDSIVNRLNAGVSGLLNRAGVARIAGTANIIDGKTVTVTPNATSKAPQPEQTIRAEHLVLATGSVPIEIPALPFGGRILSSTDALALAEIPERLAVVGGGYIGLELGTAMAKLGAAVTVIEAQDRVLSLYDKRLTRPVERSLANLGITLLAGTKALEEDGASLIVEADGEPQTVMADKILVTVGRRPRTDGFGLETLGLTRRKGQNGIAVDDSGQTSMKHVWAVGDLTGEPMLAHRAMKQGEVVAEAIAGHRTQFDPTAIPAVVFTDPEIVAVGLSPDEAASAHGQVLEGRFFAGRQRTHHDARHQPG